MKTTETYAFNYLVTQLPQPTAFINTSLELISASRTWLDYFGFRKHEVVGKSILEIFEEHDQSHWECALQRCLSGEKEQGIQKKLTTNKKEEWFEWTNVPWYDEQENIIGVIIQIADITKSLKNDLKFEKLDSLLKDQSEIAKVGTWEYDICSESLIWSDMTKKIHEVSMDYIPDMESAINFYEKGHSRNTIAMLAHNGIHRGESWSQKLKLITANGNEKWVIAAGKPLYKEGIVTRLIGTFQDVTEQVEQEKKTKESEQLLRTLVDNLPLNLYIKDTESRKVLVNKAECDYLGVKSQNELLGMSDFDLYDANIAQISRDEDLQVMKTKKPIIGKRTISVKKDGTSTSFLSSKIPLLNLEGGCKGIMGISIEISDIIQKENQLSDLINVTAIQNKKLLNFAHIVSHNLRSHTANVSMLVDFLTKEKKESEKERILNMLTRASDNLMDSLENLNEVVDISTNVNLEKKSLNLNQQIQKVQENLAVFLEQHKVEIQNTISDKVDVRAVPAYLESIILNLITNSVKYRNPEIAPKITLSTERVNDQIIFKIKDNGLGMDMNKYGNKLFGMYKTFHNNPDARGIGLYITKNQIEAMGGYISVSSEVNKGSTFSVYFKDEN